MTTAPLPDRLVVRTRAVGAGAGDGDLLELPPSPRGVLAWVREGEGLVGWGEAARVTTHGAGRFRAAQDWWDAWSARLRVDDEVRLPGSGAVAFASMAFGPGGAGRGASVLVVPRVVVGRRAGVTWITEVGGAATPERVVPVGRPGRISWSDGELGVPAWREAVRRAVARMGPGHELEKVVLAHDLVATADAPLDPRWVLRGLAERYPSCWAFAVDGLVGATPELLLRRRGPLVESRVLAGTAWSTGRGSGAEALAAALLASGKDRAEHRFAVESLAGSLRPSCTSLAVPDAPSVLRLHNVVHLATDVRGWLATPSAPLLRLAEAVHPTAAVGGTPRSAAVRAIAELEAMDRGRYAGPVGWVDAEGDGELGIALRCAEVDGAGARLFAGCGIVAGSDPEAEVAEAAAKLVPVRDALERTG